VQTVSEPRMLREMEPSQRPRAVRTLICWMGLEPLRRPSSTKDRHALRRGALADSSSGRYSESTVRDYFDERRRFESDKGIGDSFDLGQRFINAKHKRSHPATSRSPFRLAPPLAETSDEQLEVLGHKIDAVLERLESIGFMNVILARELDDYKSFMQSVYTPARVTAQFPTKEPVDFVAGSEDVKTVRYALEAFLFFASSLVEYLAQAVGTAFGDPNVKRIKRLIGLLKQQHGSAEARALADVLGNHRSIWAELEETRQGLLFDTVEPGPTSYSSKTLRDIVTHYRHLHLNHLQMSVWKDGSAPTNEILEPGTTTPDLSGRFRGFGQGKGITRDCAILQAHLKDMVTDVLMVLIPADEPNR